MERPRSTSPPKSAGYREGGAGWLACLRGLIARGLSAFPREV